MTTDTITLPRSVVEQALDAMNLAYEGKCRLDTIPNATEALRAALEQEPDAWDNCRGERQCRIWCGNKHCVSHPAPQPPVVEQPQVEQEPYLWYDENSGNTWTPGAVKDRGDTCGLVPLYDRPQPPTAEKSSAVEHPQVRHEPDAFYEWWHMRPSLTRLQAWLFWKTIQARGQA